MTGSLWIVVAGNAVAAAVLLFAASAKLVAPDVLGRSLLKLTGRPGLAGRGPVRAIGLLELVFALGLVAEPVRYVRPLGRSSVYLRDSAAWPTGLAGLRSNHDFLLVGLVGAANLVTTQPLTEQGRTAAPILAAGLLCGICIVTGRSVLRVAPH